MKGRKKFPHTTNLIIIHLPCNSVTHSAEPLPTRKLYAFSSQHCMYGRRSVTRSISIFICSHFLVNIVRPAVLRSAHTTPTSDDDDDNVPKVEKFGVWKYIYREWDFCSFENFALSSSCVGSYKRAISAIFIDIIVVIITKWKLEKVGLSSTVHRFFSSMYSHIMHIISQFLK